MEDNAKRSTREGGFHTWLQDYELLQDNKINDNGDFVHFTLMVKYEPVKMKEASSYPKWIYFIKEEMESI